MFFSLQQNNTIVPVIEAFKKQVCESMLPSLLSPLFHLRSAFLFKLNLKAMLHEQWEI